MTQVERLSPPDDGMVCACPECDKGGDVIVRTGSNTHAGNPDDDYLCGTCGATFNEPVERESRRVPQGGAKAKCADLSLEDVGLN